MPEHARLYGVPAPGWKTRAKYGFHGASHQLHRRARGRSWAPGEVGELPPWGKLVDVRDHGTSVDTTMGFSRVGLENATRHGDLDVFAVLYMNATATTMERRGRSQPACQGRRLDGPSGVAAGDVRDLEAAAVEGSRRAELALEVFVYEVKKSIGAFAAAMGGLEAVAFTAASARTPPAAVGLLRRAGILGMRLDREKNESGSGDRVVSADDSRVRCLALATNEELIVARRAYRLLTRRGA